MQLRRIKFLEWVLVYKYILFFIFTLIAIEIIFIYEKLFSSWFSLYVCFILFVIDIKKTFRQKIIMSLSCFVFLALSSCLIYFYFAENHKNTNQLLDIILSLLIPFVFYFFDYYFMKSTIKKTQKYEDEKNKEKQQ